MGQQPALPRVCIPARSCARLVPKRGTHVDPGRVRGRTHLVGDQETKTISSAFFQSGRPDSNRRPPAPKAIRGREREDTAGTRRAPEPLLGRHFRRIGVSRRLPAMVRMTCALVASAPGRYRRTMALCRPPAASRRPHPVARPVGPIRGGIRARAGATTRVPDRSDAQAPAIAAGGTADVGRRPRNRPSVRSPSPLRRQQLGHFLRGPDPGQARVHEPKRLGDGPSATQDGLEGLS